MWIWIWIWIWVWRGGKEKIEQPGLASATVFEKLGGMVTICGIFFTVKFGLKAASAVTNGKSSPASTVVINGESVADKRRNSIVIVQHVSSQRIGKEARAVLLCWCKKQENAGNLGKKSS